MIACPLGSACNRRCGSWHPFDPCPCGDQRCPTAHKLQRNGHAVGCTCRSCTGRRNRRRGQRAQANAHKRLGGTGATPTHEEWGTGYEIRVQPEVKQGGQIPASFSTFIGTDWFRRAMRQAEKATSIGSGSLPAVYLQLPGDGTGWLIVRVDGGE